MNNSHLYPKGQLLTRRATRVTNPKQGCLIFSYSRGDLVFSQRRANIAFWTSLKTLARSGEWSCLLWRAVLLARRAHLLAVASKTSALDFSHRLSSRWRAALLARRAMPVQPTGNWQIFTKNPDFHQIKPQTWLEHCYMINLWTVHHLDIVLTNFYSINNL
jgi:hypothetical protein